MRTEESQPNNKDRKERTSCSHFPLHSNVIGRTKSNELRIHFPFIFHGESVLACRISSPFCLSIS
jgi:hypothetical protein